MLRETSAASTTAASTATEALSARVPAARAARAKTATVTSQMTLRTAVLAVSADDEHYAHSAGIAIG